VGIIIYVLVALALLYLFPEDFDDLTYFVGALVGILVMRIHLKFRK